MKDLPENWEDAEGVLQYHNLLYILESIHIKLMGYHHNDLFVNHLGIDTTRELFLRKYY